MANLRKLKSNWLYVDGSSICRGHLGEAVPFILVWTETRIIGPVFFLLDGQQVWFVPRLIHYSCVATYGSDCALIFL